MNKKLKFFLGMILIMTSMACAQQNNTNSISMEEFKDKLLKDKNLVILDVRTPEELAGPLGKIENVINISIQELEQRIDELKSFKNKEIFVICRTQNRSAMALDILFRNGYKAKNVLGGMVRYRQVD